MDIYAHPYPPRDDLILGTSVTAVCAVVSIDGVFFFAALLSRVELDEESGGSNQGRRSTKSASLYGTTRELERCQGQDEQRGTERKRTSGATTDSLSVMSSGIFSGLKAIQFIESGDLFQLASVCDPPLCPDVEKPVSALSTTGNQIQITTG